MCLEERNTLRRGRALALARKALRTRRLRRSNGLILPSMRASLLLAFLAVNVLAAIANALALIGLGGAGGADFRGKLPNLLLVDAGDLDQLLFCACHLDLDARGNLVHDVVAEADLELQAILALERRLEADTVDLERVRIALGHPLDEVDHLGSRHPPHRPRRLGLLERLE